MGCYRWDIPSTTPEPETTITTTITPCADDEIYQYGSCYPNCLVRMQGKRHKRCTETQPPTTTLFFTYFLVDDGPENYKK